MTYNEGDPMSDWMVTVYDTHRKPLNRQCKESINIKKAKGGIQLRVLGKLMTVSKEFLILKMSFSAILMSGMVS